MSDDALVTAAAATPSPAASRAPHAIHGDRAVLIVTEGASAGARAVLAPGTDRPIGTAADAVLVLDDKTVSRHHVRARWDGRWLDLEDLASKNGSFFAGARFQRLSVRPGAEIRLGATAIKLVPDETEVAPAPAAAGGCGPLVGDALEMRRLYAMLGQVAPSDAAVVIEGETGTGKELVARALHARSRRADKPFVVFDCGSVPDELIESLLFGHVRGAFTGAVRDQAGVFVAGDGGTVFLDEIGELALELQPALLRVLDQGMVRAVGAAAYQKVDVRIVAATHRDLPALVAAGRFREDLYYRLAVIRMTVPPLRARPDDIPTLIRHFLARLGRADVAVAPAQVAALARHGWPGNVRELRNVVERGAVLAVDGQFALDPRLGEAAATAAPGAGERLPFVRAKDAAIAAFEREYLERLVAEHGTITAAAAAAGMDRKHLRLLLGRHGLAIG